MFLFIYINNIRLYAVPELGDAKGLSTSTNLFDVLT